MDLAEGVKALVLGMTTTFLVLILISIIISLFKYINPTEKPSKKALNNTVVTQTPVTVVSDVEKKNNELELIAVITTAIAASLNTTADKLRVTSFRKLNKNSRWK